MLAGVDYVLMGAGIPLKMPGALDRLSQHEPATYPIHVVARRPTTRHGRRVRSARRSWTHDLPPLQRPQFLAIVSSSVLGATLIKRKANGHVDGFVVEGPTAGGHNAPPRGKPQFNEAGEPIYGERDVVDLDKMRGAGPSVLAGWRLRRTARRSRSASPPAPRACRSGRRSPSARNPACAPTTSARCSTRRWPARRASSPIRSPHPRRFPSRSRCCPNTVSEKETYEARRRVCDLGYLREVVQGARRRTRLSLPVRTGARLPREGRRHRRHRRPQVRLQRAHGQRRPRAGARASRSRPG